MAKKIVRLTESELTRLIKRVVKEQSVRPNQQVNSNYQQMVDTLYKAMKGAGTDEKMITNVMNQIKTAQDFDALNNLWAKKEGQNLQDWLKEDLTDEEWKKIVYPMFVRIGYIKPGVNPKGVYGKGDGTVYR